MNFGIREKISLVVIFAIAISAFLVAQGLKNRAQEVLQQHEIVDLGDEAALRGWTVSDQVDGLAEDVNNLAYSPEFRVALRNSEDQDELRETAEKFCRRYWNEYLLVDIVEFDGARRFYRAIHTPVGMNQDDRWLPEGDILQDRRFYLSPIQRLKVERPATESRGAQEEETTVIWGMAPLYRFTSGSDSTQAYVRIAAEVRVEDSTRHFFVLEDINRNLLQRPDERVPKGTGNEQVFTEWSRHPDLIKGIEQVANASSTMSQPRVQKLAQREDLKLVQKYYFLEGIPNKELTEAINDDLEKREQFFDRVQDACYPVGRIGGLTGGVKELRLLADSESKLGRIREEAIEALQEIYGDRYRKIKWRRMVECDEIHVWSVQLRIGTGDELRRYLIHYAVMEDELASSINHEMAVLRIYTLFIAGVAGVIAFLMTMYFIRPLKEMTEMAQQISESRGAGLYSQLVSLINSLAVRRRDEVGNIARASKRLFEEIIESHEKLEQRVADRTSDLRKANFELEQANVQLKSLSHEKDAFVAKVSHDLRQPLNAIFLQVEALKLSELDDLQKQDVEKIQSHANRELNLVDDILEYQKIIMGAESLVRSDIDVRTFLGDLRSNYERNAADKGIDLVLECPEEVGILEADERRLRQVLGNLVSNACKFTKEGGVTIDCRVRQVQGKEWVEFNVTDTGRGMSPDEQSKAFVPFVSNKKDNPGGTGLGLSICKELTERMGGRIGFVSELGTGTTFSVLMPRTAPRDLYEDDDSTRPLKPELAASPRQAAEQIAIHAGKGPRGGGAKVLVIDDEPSVRELLKRLLEEDGYAVLTASDGSEGIRLARSEKPEAITLDVVMPGDKDGWEVLKELKADPETEGIPVIMVSIMAEADNGFALGVEDYLVKPVDIDRLSRVVSRVTSSAPQRNLLIVDDDVDSREVLARLLDESGWDSKFASNGIEALEVLKKTRPAAIVLDLMMPEMDGFEFLKIVQDGASLASIPVIVITGKETTATERAFLEERVGMILRKDNDSGSRKVLKTITQRLRPHGDIKRD